MKRSTFIRGGLAIATAALLSACGGIATPDGTISVTPALGAIFNGDVTVYNAAGAKIGTASTGSSGTATVELFGIVSAPLVTVLSATDDTTYFDEGKGGDPVPLTKGTKLVAVAPAVTSSIGVTPITSMAASIAGITADNVATKVKTVSATSVTTAIATTNALLGLPATFNINAAPAVIKTATEAASTTNTYSKLLKNMAEAVPTGGDAVSQLNTLVEAATAIATAIDNGNLTTALGEVSAALTVVNNAAVGVVADRVDVPADEASLNTAVEAIKENETFNSNLDPDSATGTTGGDSTGTTS